jgi:hypothetical protein
MTNIVGWFDYAMQTSIGNSLVLVISGRHSFNGRSLHEIGSVMNPYEQAISIFGRTLSPFDEDNLIPCFGFGDG